MAINDTEAYSTSAHSPIFRNPRQYLKKKLAILTDHFCIEPTSDDLIHLKTLQTKIAIDNAIISIMNRYYDKH